MISIVIVPYTLTNSHDTLLQSRSVYVCSCMLIASGCPQANNTDRTGCQVIISMKIEIVFYFPTGKSMCENL